MNWDRGVIMNEPSDVINPTGCRMTLLTGALFWLLVCCVLVAWFS